MDKIYHVYGLVCPIDHNVFYIGMTIKPRERLLGHMCDPASAAYSYCRELKAEGLKPSMVYFFRSPDKQKARELEARLTLTIPCLVNRYGTPETVIS